jgi:hypothetical protein
VLKLFVCPNIEYTTLAKQGRAGRDTVEYIERLILYEKRKKEICWGSCGGGVVDHYYYR